MAIIPQLSLQGTKNNIQSPAESGMKMYALKDAAAVGQVREIQRQSAELDLQARQNEAQAQQLWGDTIRNNWKLDGGKVVFDDAAITSTFAKAGKPELAQRYESNKLALRKSAADTFHSELTETHDKATEIGRLASGVVDDASYGEFRKHALAIDPGMQLPVLYDDTGKAAIVQAKKEAEGVRVSTLNAIQQIDYQEKLNTLPENQQKEANRMLELYKKNNGGKDPDPWMRDIILGRAMGLGYIQPRTTKPTRVGQTGGDKLPADATDIEGNPVTGKKGELYNKYQNPDGTTSYERADRAPSAAEGRLQLDIEAVQSANPTMGDAAARQFALRQNYQMNRMALINAQALSTGRELSNQRMQDILNGKPGKDDAQWVLNHFRLEAQSIANPDNQAMLEPTSPFSQKSVGQIEELLLNQYGLDKQDLVKAAAGSGPLPAPAKTAPAAAGGFGPVETRTLKSGGTVKVRKNLKTGKYEEVK